MAEVGVAGAVRTRLRPYRAVPASRARSPSSSPASFVLDLASSMLVGVIELAEIWELFHNVVELGGLDFAQILLVFGLADLTYSADGSCACNNPALDNPTNSCATPLTPLFLDGGVLGQNVYPKWGVLRVKLSVKN